jgi:hypothetical protein
MGAPQRSHTYSGGADGRCRVSFIPSHWRGGGAKSTHECRTLGPMVGTSRPPRVFLLSPANAGGERAAMLTSPAAMFSLAQRLRSGTGAPLGEVMSFLSGLYFRGKLAYGLQFAAPPTPRCPGVLVITPDRGLLPPETPMTLEALRASARVDIHERNAAYREPLAATARALARRIGRGCEVVLLGSIASEKYTAVLGQAFGDRLRFPLDFVGRGDMSRGGLLLRCVRAERELPYVPLAGATRHGQRPPRLTPLARTAAAVTTRTR